MLYLLKNTFTLAGGKSRFEPLENSASRTTGSLRPYLEPPPADDASRVIVEPEAEHSVAELG